MPTVTKNDLIDRIAKQTKRPRTEVRAIVQAFLENVIEEVGRDSRLEFRDFGVFEVMSREPRMGRNPKTGEPVPIPRRRSVKFKPGRLMRQALEDLPVVVVKAEGKSLGDRGANPKSERKVTPRVKPRLNRTISNHVAKAGA